MGILVFGLVGAMRLFPVGLKASQRAELNSRAAIAAQRTIDSLKLNAWDALAEGTTTSQESGFEVTTQIGPAALEQLADPSRIKRIEVTVRSTGGGQPHEQKFLTYVRRDSP